MDPSMTTGTIEPITANDIRALDLIGYDVPEPASMAAVLLAIISNRADVFMRSRTVSKKKLPLNSKM